MKDMPRRGRVFCVLGASIPMHDLEQENMPQQRHVFMFKGPFLRNPPNPCDGYRFWVDASNLYRTYFDIAEGPSVLHFDTGGRRPPSCTLAPLHFDISFPPAPSHPSILTPVSPLHLAPLHLKCCWDPDSSMRQGGAPAFL